MARPRNEALYQKIKTEAYHQLMTRGYTDTTYQSIATACGVTRTAVQNYFASKEDLSFLFFGDLLDAIGTAVKTHDLHQENIFDTMFCIGQSLFHFLMRTENGTTLLLDSVSDRQLTSKSILFDYAWGMDFLQQENKMSTDEKLEYDIIVAMGGFYELLYHCLSNGRDFDIGVHLGRVVRSIMHDYNYSYDEAKAFVAAHVMTEKEIDLVLTEVSNQLSL